MSSKNFKSNKSEESDDINIELSEPQATILNFLLPCGYKFEFIETKNYRTVIAKQRKPELEIPVSISLPEKRIIREKEPEILNGQGDAFKKCYKFLQSLKKNSSSNLLLMPIINNNDSIDITEDNLSISIIENKLISNDYLCAYHIGKDLRSMLSNNFLAFSREPEIFIEIFKFSKFFELQYKNCEKLVFSDNIIQELNKIIEKLTNNIKEFQNKEPQIKGIKDKKMTSLERKQLLQSIKKLDPKYLNGVIKIIKGTTSIQGGELEFDVDNLPHKVCRELEKYIKQCLQIKPLKKKVSIDYAINEKPLINNVKNEVKAHSESSESSSSSSESEDEMPDDQLYPELWDRDGQDFTNGNSIDFDKY